MSTDTSTTPDGAATPLPPIRREVVVSTDPASAFAWFTTHIGAWWPLGEFSVHGAGGSVGFEGDLLVERHGADQSVWGEVVTWEPPSTVEFTWHPGRASDGSATDIRVTFAAADDGTLVTLEHWGWERTAAPEQAREEYGHGWPTVLEKFATAIAPATADAGASPATRWFVLQHRPADPEMGGSLFADPRFGGHVAFIERMAAEGALVAAGPLPNEAGSGMMIIRTLLDEEAVTALATTEDASVTSGLLAATVRPWDVRFAP
jgi:uncharacterized protein YndB with AHSA1/START domain/uncharacterized protein YciI